MRGRKDSEQVRRTSGVVLPANGELIWGRNAVSEALRAGKRVWRLLVAERSHPDVSVQIAVRVARERGVPIDEVARAQLDAMAADHQGLVAVVAPFPYVGWGDLLSRLERSGRSASVLMLDTVQDPQNLGTLLRAAEATGIDGVVLPKRRAVQVTPAVVRASAGAVEHLAVAMVPNLVRAAQDLKQHGLWVVGVDMEGDRLYWELDMSGPTALVVGGEDRGIGHLLKERCDFLVRLPMKGIVSSLNAAVAGSIVLYEMVRQRWAT